MQSQHSYNSPSLKPLCPTRWTVRTAAINSVLTNYEVLCDTLCQMNREGMDEYAMKAGGILPAMERFCTYSGLHLFAHTYFCNRAAFTKPPRQGHHWKPCKLPVLHWSIWRSDEAFDRSYDRIIEAAKDLTSESTLPHFTKQAHRVDDGKPGQRFEIPKAYFRQQYFELLVLLHSELNRPISAKEWYSCCCYYWATIIGSC